MILVRRLRGEPLFLNEDLIESIEARPNAIVTLVDGRSFELSETPEELVEKARRYRASVLVAVEEMRGFKAELTVIHGGEVDEG